MTETGKTDTPEAFDETADAGTAKAPIALAPGSQLGKYKLERVLGEGGMGVVWAAHDPDLERAVAIKVLKYAQAAVELRQRLLREARAMAKLKHPNVLTVYEVGTAGDRDYIAMELVDGQSLDGWFKYATLDERWQAMIAAGRGLAAAHAAGVVHRDFKPHNVLRSKDGRVLVTDFGLARGLVGDGESPAVGAKALPDAAFSPFDETLAPPSKSESGPEMERPEHASGRGIDTPLTRTGALIGTPAYMAPEQYLGAPPDPRTDQFAFGVTLWQALVGERPFKGQTLEEMRTSANAGVAGIPAKMPGAIRAVLARGLDPDAKRRWPSLEEMLDALERARTRPARRRGIALALVGFALMIVMIVGMTRRNRDRTQTSCDDPDRVIAEASAPAKGTGRPATAFDDFGKRWVESYRQACKLPKGKTRTARIGCLEGERDDVAALALVLHDAPPEQLERFDAPSILPAVKSCDGASPLGGVIVPRDQPRRDQAIKALAATFALQRTPYDKLGTAIEKQYAEAKAIGGDELASAVLVTGGTAYERMNRYAEARALYTRFLKQPGPRSPRFEAIVRVGLLEASMRELVDPGAKLPAEINDPRGRAQLHPELVTLIAAARGAAGSDDAVQGSIDIIEANCWLAAGQWNRYKNAYSEALEAAERARKHFEAIGDARRTALVFATEADVYLERADERALDDALFAARQAADTLERAQLPALPEIDDVRGHIAFMRRDLTEAHRRFDGDGRTIVNRELPMVHGHVDGMPSDRPVAITTWQGTLVGDRGRVIMNLSSFEGERATPSADGSFAIKAARGTLIVAEAKGLRSRPQKIDKEPITLKLEPTTTLSGSVLGPNLLEVTPFARFTLGGNDAFEVQAPIDHDATFDLAGLPAGATPQLGLEGPAGDATRTLLVTDLKNMAWPYGQAVDVIVRGKLATTPEVYVLRGHVPGPLTAKDLRGMLPATIEYAMCFARPVGANNTDAGREVYQPGDLHCTITGNSAGPISACVVWAEQVKCADATLKPTVEVTYPDGRYAAGVTPVVVAF